MPNGSRRRFDHDLRRTLLRLDLRLSRTLQLINFIGEQYLALDAMADNRAVLFTGPAGSGKTLLAIEAARREIAQGRTGRLLCFNRLLGRRLNAVLGDLAGLSVGTFHQQLIRLAGVEPPSDTGPDFWEKELVERALEALLAGGDEMAGDFLVVDEIQDIAHGPFADLISLCTMGSGGRLLLFGDFERQASLRYFGRTTCCAERANIL